MVFDLFSMKLSNGYSMKRKQRPVGTKEKWKISSDSVIRVSMLPTSYLEREAQLVQYVTTLMEGTP